MKNKVMSGVYEIEIKDKELIIKNTETKIQVELEINKNVFVDIKVLEKDITFYQEFILERTK